MKLIKKRTKLEDGFEYDVFISMPEGETSEAKLADIVATYKAYAAKAEKPDFDPLKPVVDGWTAIQNGQQMQNPKGVVRAASPTEREKASKAAGELSKTLLYGTGSGKKMRAGKKKSEATEEGYVLAELQAKHGRFPTQEEFATAIAKHSA